MSRRIEEFEAFGVRYRARDLSAADAFHLFLKPEIEFDPFAILIAAEAEAYDSEAKAWVRLDSRHSINLLVCDKAHSIANHLVLNGVLIILKQRNVGFLLNGEWKPVKIPSRLQSGVDPVYTERIDPIFGSIVANHMATMKELQEFYSLKDAFELFDIMAIDSLNKALSNEAALADAKGKTRQ